MNVEAIRILASGSSVVGSSLLAWRVTGLLQALGNVAFAHELNINQLMGKSVSPNLIHFANSVEHVQKAKKTALLVIGFALVIASAVLQLVALVLVSGKS